MVDFMDKKYVLGTVWSPFKLHWAVQLRKTFSDKYQISVEVATVKDFSFVIYLV